MKNRVFVFLALCSLVVSLCGCGANKQLSRKYYESKKRIGIIQVIDTIGMYRVGNQGLLDIAFTQGKKYKEGLDVVDKDINPSGRIHKLYRDVLDKNGKEYKNVDYQLFSLARSNKISKGDCEFLKNNLGIDELIVVKVKYGIMVQYYGFIELARYGMCNVFTKIINIDDNSTVYKRKSYKIEKIKGKWKTPPEYDNLRTAVKTAIDKSVEDVLEGLQGGC